MQDDVTIRTAEVLMNNGNVMVCYKSPLLDVYFPAYFSMIEPIHHTPVELGAWAGFDPMDADEAEILMKCATMWGIASEDILEDVAFFHRFCDCAMTRTIEQLGGLDKFKEAAETESHESMLACRQAQPWSYQQQKAMVEADDTIARQFWGEYEARPEKFK